MKVVWSREVGVTSDNHIPLAAKCLKAAIDSGGKPTAWPQRSVFPPINSTFEGGARHGGSELEGHWVEVQFDIKKVRVENGPARAHVRLGCRPNLDTI